MLNIFSQFSTKVINTGVPQGEILGPLLLLVYINDLPHIILLFNMIMYAEDTILYSICPTMRIKLASII